MYYFLCQPHIYTHSTPIVYIYIYIYIYIYTYIHTIRATYTHEYTDCVTGQYLKIFSRDKSETGIEISA